jgi:aldose 1-epimerase
MSTLESFGTLNGVDIQAVTIENKHGLRAKFIPFGARLVALWVPDRDGAFDDIVLGFDTLEEYVATDTFFGATCGRYGNRISKGQFPLFGDVVQVDTNEGNNHLHGGNDGFDRKIWNTDVDGNVVTFTAISEDGEMGFPGRCNLTARYELTEDNQLVITMSADTDKVTLMNMVHHSYFNLSGQGSGDVLNQFLTLNSRFYTPVDDELMTTGEVLKVEGTPYDFTQPKAIGADIAALEGVGGEVFEEGGGYDHNWCLTGAQSDLLDCARIYDPASGRVMTLTTSEPGVQFYTGGYLNDRIMGKEGKKLCKYAGFTLETQKFPDAPNFAQFPNCVLRPGETYTNTMIFDFATQAVQ